MIWSVRARTTAAAVLVLGPLLALAGIAGVLVQRHELTRATLLVAEEQARGAATQVGGTGTDAPDGDLGGVLGGEETLVQVVDAASGLVLVASPALDGRPAMVGDPGTGTVTSTGLSGLEAGEADHYVAVAVPAGRTTYVVAARSLEGVDDATSSTTRLLVVGIPLAVVLAAVLTWVLTGRALAPVDRIRRRAAEISTAGSGLRLPEVGGRDEVARLGETLNAMLERIDTAAGAQRRFVADASHELRSPVAAIRTVMEVLDPTAAGAQGVEEARQDVLAESRRLERLVEALLTLARRDATGTYRREVEQLRLSEVLARELDRPRRITPTLVVEDDPTIAGDRRALETLVGNLLDNADRHAATSVDVRLTADGDDVRLCVDDDGPGVDPDDVERVFDRFVRLDESRARDGGGTGLGLAIVRAVADDHGGSTGCTRSPSGGARFEVRLPLRGAR